MSALAFLAPDAAEATAARSPMHRLAAAAGARMETRDGWEVAAAFEDAPVERDRLTEAVAFADRSQLCKLELQGEAAALASLVRTATDQGSAGALELEPRRAGHAADGTWWCPLTPTHVLALAEPSGAGRLRESVAGAAAVLDSSLTVVEVTCGLAAMTLAGPGAAELLARFCAIDVRPAVTPVAGFRPGSVARTPGYLLREREDELLVLVGWALGHYLWRVVADAAEHLGGGPVGADALAGHRAAAGA
jgi:heterotetrameric sarcosine oxidase gamma subunit